MCGGHLQLLRDNREHSERGFAGALQPVHRLISGRHTVGFKRVWMLGASEERIRCDP